MEYIWILRLNLQSESYHYCEHWVANASLIVVIEGIIFVVHIN